MTSPAEELRTAADKIRTLATAASTNQGGKPTTRWHFAERAGHRSGYLYAENPEGSGVRLIRGGAGSPGGRNDYSNMSTRHGAYAAAMDPTVGLAVAQALDEAAASVEQDGGIVQGSTTEALLDVARAINGGQP